MLNIRFRKLFGRFDYDITLNPEGLTILTGPNGFGKTTILMSIEAFGKGIEGLKFFVNLDFRQIEVDFGKDDNVVIQNDGVRLNINGITVKKENFIKELEKARRRRRSFLRFYEDTWYDRRTGTVIPQEDLDEYIYGSGSDIFPRKIYEIMEKMKALAGEIHFIREQRLIREDTRQSQEEPEEVSVIESIPLKFLDQMRTVQQEYSIIANKLDSSYPARLFKTEEGISKTEYESRSKAMALKFQSLTKYELSPMQELTAFAFKEEHAKALKIYFEDFEEKYRVYEDFINKLDLFTEILNHRLMFKSVKISKEKGICVVDDSGKTLKLTQLSSGEKQEIVLFYDLIFDTGKDELLLIDEPEISLHITWQKKFMDDLVKIIEYKGFNVIVATHSPQIITNHWEKQIDLGALYGEQLDSR